MDSFFNFTKGENMSDIEIPDTDTACSLALDCLHERYKESFIRVTDVDIEVGDTDIPDKITRYEILVAPEKSPKKMFTVSIKRRQDDHKLWGLICDNYQQYLFTPIVCKPFEEYFANCEGVDGYSASLFYNKMDDEVWTADQVEQYMGFGVDGDPEVSYLVIFSVIVMLAKNSTENLAHLIYQAHIDLAKLKRNMKFVFGISGSDMKKINNTIYSTHVDYEIFVTRKSAQISYESVLDEVSSNIKKVTDDGWDGIGTVGDLDKVIPSITWKQQDRL